MKCSYINLIAASACLIGGIAFTMSHRPLSTIATFVVVGLVNIVFVLAR